MHRFKITYSFNLNNDFVVNNHIGVVITHDFLVVQYLQWYFDSTFYALFLKLNRKSIFIHFLGESVSEFLMHRKRRGYNSLG